MNNHELANSVRRALTDEANTLAAEGNNVASDAIVRFMATATDEQFLRFRAIILDNPYVGDDETGEGARINRALAPKGE